MQHLRKTLGTADVAGAAVALIVAAPALGSDVAGYLALGGSFPVALLAGFGVHLLLALSAAALAGAHPKAGAIYAYARAGLGGRSGRVVGTALVLAACGTFVLAASAEANAGAADLRDLLGSALPREVFVVALAMLAVLPNAAGVRTTVRVSAGLVLAGIGVRWGFGAAGFLGLGATGAWSAAHLQAAAPAGLVGGTGVLTSGLAVAFWSFAGIELACSFAEEARAPRRTLPRALVAGLALVLATSLVAGLGMLGTAPAAVWRSAAAGAAGCGGACPHLAAAEVLFGAPGRTLMALASVAVTLGTLAIGYAALARLVYGLARGGDFFGPLSAPFARLDPRSATPRPALLLVLGLYLGPALYRPALTDWLAPAAYAWTLLYLAFHALALVSRRPAHTARGFYGRWFAAVPLAGLAATLGALGVAFAGAHRTCGSRAFFILAVALVGALLAVQEGVPHETPAPDEAPTS